MKTTKRAAKGTAKTHKKLASLKKQAAKSTAKQTKTLLKKKKPAKIVAHVEETTWKPDTLEIEIPGHGTHVVGGQSAGGLFVHRKPTLRPDTGKLLPNVGEFRVSVMRSGRAIPGEYATPDAAKLAAEAMLKLGNWKVKLDVKGLQAKIIAIANKYSAPAPSKQIDASPEYKEMQKQAKEPKPAPLLEEADPNDFVLPSSRTKEAPEPSKVQTETKAPKEKKAKIAISLHSIQYTINGNTKTRSMPVELWVAAFFNPSDYTLTPARELAMDFTQDKGPVILDRLNDANPGMVFGLS